MHTLVKDTSVVPGGGGNIDTQMSRLNCTVRTGYATV